MSAPDLSQRKTCALCGGALLRDGFCPGCALAVTKGGEFGSFGCYTLEARLGEGGMGEVFLAHHQTTGRAVALKIPRSGTTARETLLRRFALEARALSALDHPGILPIFEVGEENGVPYFAMKLAEGGSLADHLEGRPWPVREAAALVAEVAVAVEYAHRRGIIHRDLKPHNILLDEHGRPLLADFGLARWYEQAAGLSVGEQVLGTPDYAAPETAHGGPPSASADLFSLGAILYHLLAGEPPFRGASLGETLQRAAHGEVLSLVRRTGGIIDEELNLICLCCLERDPADRYPSAGELAADLRAWLEGQPVSVRPLGALDRLRRVVRRNPLVTALSLSTAFVIALALAGLLLANRRMLALEHGRSAAAASLAAERLGEETRARVPLLLLSGKSGQRRETLALLRREWQRRPDVELRSLAIRALALADFAEAGKSAPPRDRRRMEPVRTPAIAPASGRRAFARGENESTLRIEKADGTEEGEFLLPDHVACLAWSPDESRLAIGCRDKSTFLWRLATRTLERHPTGRDSETVSFAWHPEGKFVACVLEDEGVCLWNTDAAEDSVMGYFDLPEEAPVAWADRSHLVFARGAHRRELALQLPAGLRLFRLPAAEERRENFRTLDLESGLKQAVVVTARGARIWDLERGGARLAAPKGPAEWLGACFAGGSLFVGGWDSGLRRIPNSAWLSETEPGPPGEQGSNVGCVLMGASLDGRWLALLERPLDRFLVLHPDAPDAATALAEPEPYWISLSGDGACAATSSFQHEGVRLWHLPEGRMTRNLPIERSATVALSPDGRSLLTASSQRTALWDTADGRELRSFETQERPQMAAWSSDSAFVAVQTRLAVYLFRAADGQLLARLQHPAARPGDYRVALTFDKSSHLLGEQLSDGSLLLWDLDQINGELAALGMNW